MKTPIAAAAMATLLGAGAALAVEPELGAKLGTSADQISAALGQSGYEMTKYERERREIEVKARKDGRYVEVKINPRTGEVSEVKEKSRRRGDDS